MIILDTNVIAELMKPSPLQRVENWLAAQPRSILYTTAVCQAEVLLGIELLPHGRRREALHEAATAMFKVKLAGHVVPFTDDASQLFASIAVSRRRAGHPIGQFDCQIAAIARLHDAALATRDTTDFRDCGLRLIDPWD